MPIREKLCTSCAQNLRKDCGRKILPMKSSGHDGLWKVVMRKAGEHGQTTPSRGLYGYTKSRVIDLRPRSPVREIQSPGCLKRVRFSWSSQSHKQGITTSWGDRGTFGRWRVGHGDLQALVMLNISRKSFITAQPLIILLHVKRK